MTFHSLWRIRYTNVCFDVYSMLVDNFNVHITPTGETVLQALQQVAVVERLTSANRSVIGIQLMELLPNLMEVNVVDLHAPIIKNGQLSLGTNYKRLSLMHGNGEFTSLDIISVISDSKKVVASNFV